MDSITNVLQSIADAIRAQGSSGSGQNWESGDFKWRAVASVGAGWLLCDGSVVSQSTYAALFAAIGTSHNTGGEGVGNFRLPNLKGRVMVAYDSSQTEFDTLGEIGGHKLMQAHTHGVPSRFNAAAGSSASELERANTAQIVAGDVTTTSTGGGNAQNLQPYIVEYCFIKT